MTDDQLDKMLDSFGGLKNGIDPELQKKIGKLLVDEADEEINVSSETAWKVFKSIGGLRTISVVIFLTLIKKYYDWQNERVKNEFAATDPITQ